MSEDQGTSLRDRAGRASPRAGSRLGHSATITSAERAVMVCPQCEGEGGYPDGTDEAACHTECTRCGSNGWIVDLNALYAGFCACGGKMTVFGLCQKCGGDRPSASAEEIGHLARQILALAPSAGLYVGITIQSAQAIEAGTGETERLDPKGESAVRKDAPKGTDHA